MAKATRFTKNPVVARFARNAASVKVVTTNTTLTADDSGKVIFCNAADLVISLPSTADGLEFTVYTNVLSTGTGTSISPTSVDKITGSGVTPADNKDLINTGATDVLGDFVTLVGDGVDGWYVVAQNGIWARET